MSNVIDINTTKTRIARLLSEATPTAEQPKFLNISWSLLVASLIGTMLPFKILVTFFSLLTVITTLIGLVLILKKQISVSRPAAVMLVALLTTSVLSGCAPAIFGNNSSELYNLIQQRDYKYHSMQKVGVFGLGLDELTIGNAQLEADIETVYVAKLTEGYGIVSLSRITVAGE
jgi:hypothetical protein